MPRRAFIDCGAFDGDTEKLFLSKYPNAESYERFCFEPDPRVECPGHFDRRAAWVYDGQTALYLGDPQSSSVFACKSSGGVDPHNCVSVPCINLAAWMLNKFIGYDHVVLKLDIEGAEYPVVRHLCDTGAMALVHELYVEWHYDRIGLPVEEHEDVISHLKRRFNLTSKNMHGEDLEL